VPKGGAGTLAVSGDMKQMSVEYVRGASFRGYGVSLGVGIGVAIPVLDADMAKFTGVSDADITAPVIDYSIGYPEMSGGPIATVTYAELRSGKITVNGKEIPTGAISSYPKARKIAETLKGWIGAGKFLLSEPLAPLPSSESGYTFKPLKERKK
jgi:uncharacterized protein (DUF39 family)